MFTIMTTELKSIQLTITQSAHCSRRLSQPSKQLLRVCVNISYGLSYNIKPRQFKSNTVCEEKKQVSARYFSLKQTSPFCDRI